MGKDILCSKYEQTSKLVHLLLPWKQSLCVCMGGHTHNTHKGNALGHSLCDNPFGALVSLWPITLRYVAALTNRLVRWWKFISSSLNSPGWILWVCSWKDGVLSPIDIPGPRLLMALPSSNHKNR